ncbi:MAG: endolytic transglycosylase MltG, partial [Patescibacteria group bacterium]|nr:endolytic transglycosylase MltG [Patescibacteria group bacterium]
PLEGKLFPDTYYFYENSTPQDVIQLLTRTFEEQTKPLLLDIQASGRTPADVITMASIVEKEAASSTDRRIIAGILWKRLDMGMPLQVDAPFFYLYGKTSAELTLGDLQSDTPYNTYKYTGLPPTPIDNPGYEAIEDTVNPVKSDYLYFLSGKDGQMHYAATLAQHAANRLRYLE